MPKRGTASAASPAKPPEDSIADDPWAGSPPPGSESAKAADPSPEETPADASAPAAEGETTAKRRGRRTKPAEDGAEEPKTARKPKAADARGFDFTDVDTTGEITFEDLDTADEYVSVLYYGAEGTTKTTSALLATRLPDKGSVLLINAEGGAKKSALVGRGIDASRVKLWPPRGQRVSYDGLEKLFYKLAADLKADKDSWCAVIWDSGTEVVQSLLDQVVEKEFAEQQEILAATGGRAGNIKLRDRFDNDRDDYRIMSNQVRSLIRKYRYLPAHFIMTALLRTDINDKTKAITSIGPAVTPALQTDILGYVDVVAYCKATTDTDGQRVLYAQTYPEGKERAKDRFDVLPGELVNPTFDRIVAYVRGELVAEDDATQAAMPGGQEKRKPAAEKPARSGRRSRAKVAEPEPEDPSADDAPAAEDGEAVAAAKAEQVAKANVKEEIADKAPVRRAARASRTTRNAARQDKAAEARTERPAVAKGGFNEEPPF